MQYRLKFLICLLMKYLKNATPDSILLKILSNKSWRLARLRLSTLYKTLIRSVLTFLSLKLLSNESIRRLQVVQNMAIRRFLKIKLETPLETLDHLALKKLKIHRIGNRLFDLNESYIKGGLKKFNIFSIVNN